MNRRNLICLGGAAGMLLLILDGRTALAGAQEGVALCIRTVIPSLFPFFVLSGLVTGSLNGTSIPLLRPLGRLFRIPAGTEGILLTGFLGGYPVGAQAVAEGWRTGQLSKDQAQRMLAFCNNPGPSFLFGILASQFPDVRYAWALWGVLILSAFLTARILPAGDLSAVNLRTADAPSITDCLKKAITVMAAVCGWVVLFRVVIAFLDRWILWLLPVPVQILLTGLLELTNGCCSAQLVGSVGLRFLLCAGMLSLGGVCVTMQTLSVIGGLDSRKYLLGKLLQGIFAISLVQLLFPAEYRIPLPPAAVLGIFAAMTAIFLGKKRKSSSNSLHLGV